MSISPSQVNLLVATLYLNEVQGVIGAMRAADRAVGPLRDRLGIDPRFEPRRVIHPEPRYEPRKVLHPEPRYEPRPVIHPSAQYEVRNSPCECPPQVVVVRTSDSEGPLAPPWKTPLWKIPQQPAPKVKLAPSHPDIASKGAILDVFI